MLRALCIFLLGGGLLYVLDISYDSWQQSRQFSNIVVTENDVRRLHDEFFVKASRKPTEEELRLLIESYISREMLVKEAIRIGVHLTDSVVRERLIMNMGFLEQGEYLFDQFGNVDVTEQDLQEQEDVFQRALAMGMAETDNIVRKRLEERMTKIITRTAVEYPDEEALKEYLRNNMDEYGFGKQIHLVHAFFPKNQLERHEIASLHRDWVNGIKSDNDILKLSSQSYVDQNKPLSEYSLVRLFGSKQGNKIYSLDFPAIMDVHETVTGFHLLRVKDISDSVIEKRNLDLIEDRVITEYMREKESLAIKNQLNHWRQLYDISIEMEGI